jgi:hypothetical protein
MNLEEALKRIKELEEENNRLKAELFNERKEKEKALLALLHQKKRRLSLMLGNLFLKQKKLIKL